MGDTKNNNNTRKEESIDFWSKSEAYFFNHGSSIGLITLYVALNVGVGAWGIWQFIPPQFSTSNDILRITLPIARAGGRLVTFNIALLLLTGCKYMWTLVRSYIPTILQGFPLDNIMPYYHKNIAYWIILNGCIIHTIPQLINYGSKTLKFEKQRDAFPNRNGLWLWGDGLAITQLFITGMLLLLIFGVGFTLTTRANFRHTTFGFRMFWLFHIFGITTCIPLLIIHGTILGNPILLYFIILPLLFYTMDVVARRIIYVSQQRKIATLQAFNDDEDEKVIKLALENNPTSPDYFYYTPGQYAEIQIPSISPYEWHPFTIASSAGYANHKSTDGGKKSKGAGGGRGEGDETVVFFIKATGKWTNQLYDLAAKAKENPDVLTHVNLRGPYGAPAQNYMSYEHLIVIGSGIGVTPLLSIWSHLVNIYNDGTGDFGKGDTKDDGKGGYDSSSGSISSDDDAASQDSRDSHDSGDGTGKKTKKKKGSKKKKTTTKTTKKTKKGIKKDTADEDRRKKYSWVRARSNFHETEASLLRRVTQGSNINHVDIVSLTRSLSTSTVSTVDTAFSDPDASLDDMPSKKKTQKRKNRIAFSTFQGKATFFASVLESMTINIVLFCLSVAMETFIFVLWLFDFTELSALLQIAISLVAWVMFGTKVLLSIIAYGFPRYISSIVCQFEVSIIVLDGIALLTSITHLASPSRQEAISYFTFFAAFMIVHGMRIFHIYAFTAKPPVLDGDARGALALLPFSSTAPTNTIQSIKGIWVSKSHASMKFAARDIVDTLQLGLSSIFSMEFYGTREKKPEKSANTDEDDPNLVMKRGRHTIRVGRPDWEQIFYEAIEFAHETSVAAASTITAKKKLESDGGKDGGGKSKNDTPTTATAAVGVFFCGSPAIAKALQRASQNVTAFHQHRVEKETGIPCLCRVLVHKENF